MREVREWIAGSQSQDLVRRPFTKTTRGVEGGVGAGGWKRTQEMEEAAAPSERGILWWVSWEAMAGGRAGGRRKLVMAIYATYHSPPPPDPGE